MRYKILSALAAVTLAGAACSNITDINSNPNGPVDVPPPSILSSVEQGVLTNWTFSAGEFNVRYGGLWAQQTSEIQYPDEDRYIVRSGVTGGWPLYYGAAEDAQRMIDAGIAASNPNWEAVGRIMKAYIFSLMTDAMGDIPYTDALRGDSMLQPTYDTQQVIYDSLFANLTKASQEIAPSAGGFPSGDLIYGGDMTEWQKLANSLQLRLAMHLTNVDPALAKTEVQAALGAPGGVFTSNADNAGLAYLAGAPDQNPIYTNVYVAGRDDYGMSRTLVDSMLNFNDPRLPMYAQPNDTGAYVGRPNGLLSTSDSAPPNKYVSRFGAYWRETPNANMYFMTYAEVLLLEAEAAERGWINTGTAGSYYAAAIRASMGQWGIDSATANTYLTQSAVAYAGGATGLHQIAYELWVQLYMNGGEAWTEWRRTEWPPLMPGQNAVQNAGVLDGIPERMPYDDQEAVLNAANLDAAVARQKLPAANDLFTPLWFTGRAP